MRLAARVVGDQAQRARAGRREQRPECLAVVGDQARGCARGAGFGAGGGEAEAEVCAVAPQGAVQQGPVLVLGGQGVERGQFLVRLPGVELGQLEGAERIDALPGSGAEVADGAEELAVEVALRP